MEFIQESESGFLSEGVLEFSSATLAGWKWPAIEITAPEPGPRLAIMAGLHANEVSSMEAAIRLKECFKGALLRGRVSIIPVVNLPALYHHTEFNCPIDDKNINFCFPGDPDGTFSEALAHALLSEWSADAEVLVDLHGGDLREKVARFVMVQMTGSREFDDETRALARCFDAEIVVAFAPGQSANSGRATNAAPALGRHAIMAEAGANGILDEGAVHYHVNGVLNIAGHLGIAPGPRMATPRPAVMIESFERVVAPCSGRFYPEVDTGQRVAAGQMVARIHDIFGRPLTALTATADGYVVFRVTHNIVSEGDWVMGIGIQET
jgi:predicted deacylase